jgi:hypothetical protein
MFVQWGTFNKGFNSNTCLSIAFGAVRNQGYQVFNPDWPHEFSLFCGKGADLLLQVVCVPENANQTYIIVTAYSNDEPTAELARNSVRDEIVRTVPIDNVP